MFGVQEGARVESSVGRHGDLLTINNLHIGCPENRALVEEMRPETDDDWLLVAGDVAETGADIRWPLETLAGRFAEVVWVPGNLELWTHPSATVPYKGVERYEHLVAVCRELDHYRSCAVIGGEPVHRHAPNGVGRTGRPLSRPGRLHRSCPWSEPGGRSPSRPGRVGAARGEGEALNHLAGGAGAPHAGTAPGVPDRTATSSRSAPATVGPRADQHTIEPAGLIVRSLVSRYRPPRVAPAPATAGKAAPHSCDGGQSR
ncbi:metallophosphoesterase [Streptomyces sp. NPDC057474]|uniref:metallophosphoesterase n=1 Tax=Streptomyces sp. NPDC057474 TaxID=3346144 RepID=UPI0036B1A572